MRGSDPYAKERAEEFAAYNRLTIRTMPAIVIGYVLYIQIFTGFIDAQWNFEKFKILLLVVIFQLNVEAIYKFLRNDNIYFTLGVFGIWCWCIYKIYIVAEYNMLEIFIPLNVVLIMILRVSRYIDKYIEIKQSI